MEVFIKDKDKNWDISYDLLADENARLNKLLKIIINLKG